MNRPIRIETMVLANKAAAAAYGDQAAEMTAAMTAVFIVLAEKLEERGLLDKEDLAESLRTLPGEVSQEVNGEMFRTVLGLIMDGLLSGIREKN